jgi:hypothetical protein
MGAVAPDVEQIRNAFSQNLMKQRNEAMRGVQDVYAGRGTTGSGEEAFGLGQTGYNFGVGMGQGEAQLQQYLGILGQQQHQFDVGQGNWQQQFGEGQRQFDKSYGLQYGGMMGQLPGGEQTMAGKDFGAAWDYSGKAGYGSPFEQGLNYSNPEQYQRDALRSKGAIGGDTSFGAMDDAIWDSQFMQRVGNWDPFKGSTFAGMRPSYGGGAGTAIAQDILNKVKAGQMTREQAEEWLRKEVR